ncbi:MAG: potassium transporter [Desulfobacterales bacterium]|nr:potassium transporter [Desulfobacterales bacterium]MBL7226221.1 potassium transporter [Desulfobacteraceae bacterium]
MKEIWIIGVGQFGLLAYQRLSKKSKGTHFVLVDPVRENLLQYEGPGCTIAQADGVDFLENHLHAGNKPDWVIPALPVHLAAEWFLVHLGPERLRRVSLPSEIDPLLPNPIRGSEGNVYVSHADFRCPDDCAEPRDICTVTNEKRKQNMFEILGDLQIPPFQASVIRSYQLGAGIGGYRPGQLLSLMDAMERAKGCFLVSTACRCHGVVTGLERL